MTESELEIVGQIKFVDRHAGHGALKGKFSVRAKMSGGTPRVGAGICDNPMMHRVVIYITQPCQTRALVGKPGIPIFKPHLATRSGVEPIDFFGGSHVQFIHYPAQSPGIARRFRDEVIVIGEHRPCVKLPAELFCAGVKTVMEKLKPVGGIEEEVLLIRSRRNHEEAAFHQ